MDQIHINGGRPLNGEVTMSGAKNAALPIIAASILVGGRFVFHNIPNLKDIESIGALLSTMGAEIAFSGHTMTIDTGNLSHYEAPYEYVRKMRASILVLGPLLARMKRARVSLPGGCAIGARPIDQHLNGLTLLGAQISVEHGYVEASANKLTGAEIYLDLPTVTGTENLMMAAVMAEGRTVLHNVAREPEITALADVLKQMGADISGAGSSIITINGGNPLHTVEADIIPDRIETGTFMVAAALTGGDILIHGAEPDHLKEVILKLKKTGANVFCQDRSIRVKRNLPIRSVDVKTLPYPGFPTDMQAQFMVLMTVAKGFSVISENVFENRFIHVSELQRMGADISLSGSHAMVRGVPHLSGAQVMATDLRASACLVLAGLVATGTTQINRVYHLDRGYDGIEDKFACLGASIQRITV